MTFDSAASALGSRRGASTSKASSQGNDDLLLCIYKKLFGKPLLAAPFWMSLLVGTTVIVRFAFLSGDHSAAAAAADAGIAITSETSDETQHVHENGISILPQTYSHLQTLSSFPKTVHLIWNDKNILSTQANYEMLEHGAKNLQRLNKGWQFIVHDFADMDNSIRNFNQNHVLPAEMKESLLRGHIVEKTDAFRLIKIYEMGGLYVDMDRAMNVNLNDIIDVRKTKMVLPTYYDINFAQDMFGSSPQNDLILNVLRRQCEKRKKFPRSKKDGWIKSSDHMDLVYTFSESLEEDIFGKMLNKFGANKESIWNETRHVLQSHSNGMIVTKKDVWCDGLLVKDYEGCKRISRQPLYDAYNVIPWAKQVNEAWRLEEGK